LLIDFLEHEVFEAALFRHDRIPGNALDGGLDRIGLEVCHADSVAIYNRHFAVAKEEHVAGVLQDGWNI
jgi:hypothetical protein